MNMLLKLDNPADIFEGINLMWGQKWKNTESKRYTVASKEAYRTLKKTLKYHLYKKRDGSIISAIKLENGMTTSDQDIIDRELAKTMTKMQTDHSWTQLKLEPFPKYPT